MNNKVTFEQVEALLDSCEVQETIFWDKELVVSYKLPNGFTVLGRGACVDPKNFDINIGRTVARQQAADTVWLLLGYELQNKLYNEGLL
ncbi:hypothetical protein LPP2_g29 [Leptolyngbya phage LPP-2, strain SPI]|uniref:Phage protein n=1 Tax=Leptolyngbya phage LPP-2, strain SPI TaxID=2996053 RepID=A0AAE9TFB0_9CAUD|nr:hypothetical protein LPP2_g29 [Leptolyngbya phage LPP-2 st. SPI]